MRMLHTPVLVREVIDLLGVREGDIVLDATVGEGGHSEEILRRIGESGFLIGVDLDESVLEKAQKRLERISSRFFLINCNYREVEDFLSADKRRFNRILLDLGVSSVQLDTAERGFSFLLDAELDMRMGRRLQITAKDIINSLSEEELSELFFTYGQERYARRIANMIVSERKKNPILTTSQLADICRRAYPKGYHRINSATRVFQALRIAVNDELRSLSDFVSRVPELLLSGGRIAIISYHSLEDRIVKWAFRQAEDLLEVTKKPVYPSLEEIERNRRARSAKLRVAERI